MKFAFFISRESNRNKNIAESKENVPRKWAWNGKLIINWTRLKIGCTAKKRGPQCLAPSFASKCWTRKSISITFPMIQIKSEQLFNISAEESWKLSISDEVNCSKEEPWQQSSEASVNDAELSQTEPFMINFVGDVISEDQNVPKAGMCGKVTSHD